MWSAVQNGGPESFDEVLGISDIVAGMHMLSVIL